MARPPSHSVKLCRRPPLSLLYPSALGLGFGVGFSSHLPSTFLYPEELGSLLFDFRTFLRPARLPSSPGCHAGHLLVQTVEFANRLEKHNQSISCIVKHYWLQGRSDHVLRNAYDCSCVWGCVCLTCTPVCRRVGRGPGPRVRERSEKKALVRDRQRVLLSQLQPRIIMG